MPASENITESIQNSQDAPRAESTHRTAAAGHLDISSEITTTE
jgi:hypothetical protein